LDKGHKGITVYRIFRVFAEKEMPRRGGAKSFSGMAG